MAEVNFADLANVKLKDAVPMPIIPEGWYRAQIVGLMKTHNAKSGNLAFQFPFKVIEALEDVDADELAAAGGIPNKQYAYNFWMSEEARFRFGDFGRSLGKSNDLGLVELAEEIGQELPVFKIQCKHEQMQDRDGNPRLNTDGTPAMRVVWDNATGEE